MVSSTLLEIAGLILRHACHASRHIYHVTRIPDGCSGLPESEPSDPPHSASRLIFDLVLFHPPTTNIKVTMRPRIFLLVTTCLPAWATVAADSNCERLKATLTYTQEKAPRDLSSVVSLPDVNDRGNTCMHPCVSNAP